MTAENSTRGTIPPRTGWAILGAFGALIGALVAYAASSGQTSPAEIAGHFTASVAGAICLGGLVYVLITACPDERGVLDPSAFRAHLLIERIAPLWLISALAMVVVQSAADASVPPARVLSSGLLGSAVGASESARAWVVVAFCAAVLTVALRLTVRWDWHVALMIPAAVGAVAVPVTGNAGQGADHDYATSAMIVFAIALTVLAGIQLTTALIPAEPAARRRAGAVSAMAAAIALPYGALLLFLMAGPANIVDTGYGRLGMVLAAALSSVLLITLRQRRIDHDRIGLAGAALPPAIGALIAVAAMSAMAVQTAPRLLAEEPSIWDILLGYELPGPPTVVRLLTFWRFDSFLCVAALALAAGYLAAVIALRRRGDRWPIGRLVAWLGGCAALLLATSSGVRAYGSAMFSVHMGEHMTLNMLVPVLLVLGAPVTLALRALPSARPGELPGPREWILRLVHSPITSFTSYPVIAFVLFVGSLYAVYFTPVFDTLVRYHWGHELMSVHFLITGYLFYWGIIGVDPGPRLLPFIGRLVLLFAAMPFHAFFGIATMTMTSAIGGNFYRGLALPWVSNLNDDQHLGGAIAWGSSEVPLIMVVVALVTQWARQDRRDGVRADRHADAGYGEDELEAYNAMLRELARTRR